MNHELINKMNKLKEYINKLFQSLEKISLPLLSMSLLILMSYIIFSKPHEQKNLELLKHIENIEKQLDHIQKHLIKQH